MVLRESRAKALERRVTLKRNMEEAVKANMTDALRKADTLVLTSDLTTTELAEALASLRFYAGSRCRALRQRC